MLKLPATQNRVINNTKAIINQKNDQEIKDRINKYKNKSQEEIGDRIKELDKEWDTERTLETNFGALVLLSTLLGYTVNKKWFALGGIASAFLLQHAIQGWCPPLPVIRNIGIRSSKEINREKNALKVLRGDYSSLINNTASSNSE
ncbi:hypothetical protein JCM14036_21710 [Desulfotomaculum defluvii]